MKAESDFFRKAACVCGAASASLGALGLAGWISGWRLLASFTPNYIPIAPDTATALVIIGLALFVAAYRPLPARGRVFVGVIVAAASTYGSLKIVEYLVKTDLTFENLFFPITGRFGSFPLGRMSPISGALFFLSGIALLAFLLNKTDNFTRTLISGLGVLVLIAGLVATTGYLFGTPLLYGGDIIPLSAPTALAFLLLGTGLVAVAGPASVFVRPFVGPSVRARMLRAFVPLIAIVVLVQGLLQELITEFFDVNHALLSGTFSLIFMAITAVVVTQVARIISRAIDSAEAERKRAEKALRQSEERFSTAFHSSPVASKITRLSDSRLVDVNGAYRRLFGFSPDDHLGRPGPETNDFVLFDSTKRESTVRQLAKQGSARDYEVTMRSSSGEIRYMLVSYEAIEIDGQACTLSMFYDITERKQAEEALASERNLLRTLIDNLPEQIFVKDTDSRLILCNTRYAGSQGITPEAALGKSDYDLYSSDVAASYRAEDQVVVQSGQALVEREEPIVDASGKEGWVLVSKVPLRDSHGQIIGIVGIKRDITERKRAEEQLRALSLIDELTGLYNRRGFLTLAEQQLKTANRFQKWLLLLFVDIDNMKWINDTWGHSEGDQVLVEAATILQATFRESDIVARLGGDEFVILAAETSEDYAEVLTARLLQRLDARNLSSGRRYPLGLSVGVSRRDPTDTCSIDELLARADQLMYEQKRSKRKGAAPDVSLREQASE